LSFIAARTTVVAGNLNGVSGKNELDYFFGEIPKVSSVFFPFPETQEAKPSESKPSLQRKRSATTAFPERTALHYGTTVDHSKASGQNRGSRQLRTLSTLGFEQWRA
jgi:hypothetical protein